MMIAHPRYWKLGIKLPLTIIAAVAGVALTVGLAVIAQERSRIRQDLEEKALLVARGVSGIAYEAVLRNDYWSLFKALSSMTSSSGPGGVSNDAVAGMVLDVEGRVLAHLTPEDHPVGLPLLGADPSQRQWLKDVMRSATSRVRIIYQDGREYVESVVPIQSNGSTVGVVVLRLSTQEIETRTAAAAVIVIGIVLVFGALGSGFGVYISRRMVRPLNDLADGMAALGKGDFTSIVPIRPRDHDEIGRLAETFNHMACELAEKRQLEQQLAVSEKLVAVGRIAAGVAHEVNNPLAGMLNCLDTIRRYPDDPSLIPRYFPMIEKGLHRIRAIVQGLLIELKGDVAEVWGDGGCLEDVKDLVLVEIGALPVQLHWRNQLGDSYCVNCGPMQQVVLNLVKNAIQACREGGDVAFRAFTQGDQVVVEVEDNGPGIPLERLDKVFDPFYTNRPDGTGLGLWVTYRLVEKMAGSIEVESEPGLGCLFRVRIPGQALRRQPSTTEVA